MNDELLDQLRDTEWQVSPTDEMEDLVVRSVAAQIDAGEQLVDRLCRIGHGIIAAILTIPLTIILVSATFMFLTQGG